MINNGGLETDMKVELSVLNLPGASIEPENPLPLFRDRHPDGYSGKDDTLTEEEQTLLNYEANFRILPYCMQDRYTREKKPMQLKTVILENDKLKATFLCGYGAKLHSLVKKETGKEILFSNTVIQPGNLAIRNAWTSGGIEWNISQLGHSFTTCENIFMAKMTDKKLGEFVRVFEFERQKGLFWYIDFYLPEGSELLFAYVRIVNPNDTESPMYWWTNTAVPESDKTRLFSNVSRCLVLKNGAWTATDLPHHPAVPGVDISYSKGFPFSNEFFFQTPKGTSMPWEAVVNEDGTLFCEASTELLRYRKMFCWGSHQGGQHWQEYLSEPNKGYYVEVQAGMAPTQRHGLKMPANTVWDFVQAFGETVAPEESHSPDWNKAKKKVEKAVKKHISEKKLYKMLEKGRSLSEKTPSDFLNFGSGWGALETERLALEEKSVPQGFYFPSSSMGEPQMAWLGLLRNGVLYEKEEHDLPFSWMVQPAWRKILEESLEKQENRNWFSLMHLGNMLYEDFQEEAAAALWEASLEKKPTQWVYRNLAVKADQFGRKEQALSYMEKAYALENSFCDAGFYEEYFKLLSEQGDYEKIWQAIQTMPVSFQKLHRMQIIAGQAALATDNLSYVEPIFETENAVIREGELTLVDMWYRYSAKKLAKERGVEYSDELYEEAKKLCPPPKNVDYRIN